MAGYSDNRGQNYEAKYLRKVLGEVDDGIPVPDSVRGDVLRAKLDNVYPDAKAAPNKKSGTVFGLRWFGWQSGVTYAAAFTLIVALFYGLGLDRQAVPDIVGDGVALTEPEVPVTFDAQAETESVTPEQSAWKQDSSENAQPSQGGADNAPASHWEAPQQQSGEGGVGGGGQATVLGTLAGYTYVWRANDATDPDKGAYPVTMDVISDADAKLVAQIDIEDMQTVTAAYFTDTALVLVGADAQAVVTRSYDVTDPRTPGLMTTLSQPGAYVGSHLHENTVHTVTFTEDAAALESIETEALPHALSENACVISAVDCITHASAVKAFSGADNDITLYDLSTYISFMGEVDPEAEIPAGENSGAAFVPEAQAMYIAQIRMDGLDIFLASVT